MGSFTKNPVVEHPQRILSLKAVSKKQTHILIQPNHHHSSSYSPGPAIIFFNEKDLKVGNKFDLYNMVDKTLAATSPLAHQEVDSIPFASVSLVDMLHRFSIPLDSPLAKKVARSLHMCVSPPQRSEHKFCATSLVPMHDFVSSILGPKAKPQVLAATLYIGENRPPLGTLTL
ncbi:hypothetical protein AMTR_s00087p00099700 [Amborella trichopoda]|uniref:BURP domain-containing protein n=1 Tax=Amborella trichopoda TaxID=13333 RepID=W1P6H2_AMBTC|nr:hypothetical protein AMTR_s00087p00099700 [Amborella trichopoda]